MSALLSLCLLPVFLALASSASNYSTTTTSPPLDCPIPFIEVGGRCLFLDPLEHGDWHLARGICEMLHGDMIKLDDANFIADLVDYINGASLTVDYWVGASDEASEGDWYWTDGTSVRMGTPYWGYLPDTPVVQEPKINTSTNCGCILVTYLYFLHDCTCGSVLSPICEYKG